MVLPPDGQRVTDVARARRLTVGQPKPPVPPFRSGVHIRGVCGLDRQCPLEPAWCLRLGLWRVIQ